MSITIIATAKSGTANSYATLEQATTYFNDRLNASAFTGADADDQARALIMATRHIDAHFRFAGSRTDTTTPQALQWPRVGVMSLDGDEYLDEDTIPTFLLHATCEQALFELGADRTANPELRGIKRAEIGSLKVEADGIQSQSQFVIADIVETLLAPWVEGYLGASPGFETRYLARV